MAENKGRKGRKTQNAFRTAQYASYKASKRREQNKARNMIRSARKCGDFLGTLKKNLEANGDPDVRRFAEKALKQKFSLSLG